MLGNEGSATAAGRSSPGRHTSAKKRCMPPALGAVRNRTMSASVIELMGLRVVVLCAVLPGAGACADSRPSADGAASTSATTATTVPDREEAEVTVELWHCGVRPVTFLGENWLASSFIDQTTAPQSFTGRGNMELVREDLARYTDDGSGTTIDLARLVGEYDPPPCA